MYRLTARATRAFIVPDAGPGFAGAMFLNQLQLAFQVRLKRTEDGCFLSRANAVGREVIAKEIFGQDEE